MMTETSELQNGNYLDKNKAMHNGKWKNILSQISVEPVMALYMLASNISVLTIQNLTLEKACRVNLGFKRNTCDALMVRNSSLYTIKEEIAVQKLVATMVAWKSVLESIIPAMLLLFLGSWSDKHRRRKPLIAISLLGSVSSSIGFLCCTLFFYELPMEFTAISEALPQIITGGWFTLFMASFSYIAENTSNDSRTSRIGIVHMILDGSIALGLALCGVLFHLLHFYGVFLLCLVIYIIAFLYAVFIIKEENYKTAHDVKLKKIEFVKDFFNLKRVKETFQVAFKDDENNRKMRVCFIFILVVVLNGPFHGDTQVMYLYVRYRYNWTEIDYSIFLTYKTALHMTGMIFSISYFSKYLKLDDSLLGAISVIGKLFSCFLYAFAPTATIFYLGPIVELFQGASIVTMRSIISKLVLPDELGKINSLFGVFEALMPLVFGPMYSMLYKSTIEVLPGGFFLVGGLFTIVAIVIFMWLYYEQKQDNKKAKKNEIVHKKLLK